jgi:hypothetical protein
LKKVIGYKADANQAKGKRTKERKTNVKPLKDFSPNPLSLGL